MTYYQDQTLLIRDMEPADAQILNDEYTAQGWHPDVAYYYMRMKEMSDFGCIFTKNVVPLQHHLP